MAVHQDPKTKKWFYEYTDKNRKHVRKTGFASKGEAKKAETISKSLPVEEKKKLYDLIDEKLDNVKTFKAQSSYNTFYSLYKLHIKPFLPNKSISKITKLDINNYLNVLSKSGRSNNTINKVISFLKSTFQYALENEYIVVNPFLGIKNKPTSKRKINYWTYEQFNKAIEYETDPTYKAYFIFSMTCGIRKGERVIKWTDVDFEHNTVVINKHIYEGGQKDEINIKEGRKNRRDLLITLDKMTANVLKEHKEYCKKFDGYSEDSYVFGVLKPIPRTSIKRHLDNLCEKANLPHITPHSLRHSMTSMAYQAGLPTQIIAARLGDSPEQVYRTYGHLQKGADKPIAELFDELNRAMEEKEKSDNEQT